MPKTKKNNEIIENIQPKKAVEKILGDDEEKELDPDVILGEEGVVEEEEEEMLDGEDVDPFHDKWEE
jgi:hypothetical protein